MRYPSAPARNVDASALLGVMAAMPVANDARLAVGRIGDDSSGCAPDPSVVLVTHDRTQTALGTLHRTRAAAEGLAGECRSRASAAARFDRRCRQIRRAA